MADRPGSDDQDRNLQDEATADLLCSYAAVLVELRRRGVVRTGNAPVGDYAEWLVAGALDGTLASSSSAKSSDLTLPDGRRIQVKARLVGKQGKGQLQTSPFRSWDFDAAALVLLDGATYNVKLAVLAPVDTVRANAKRRKHVNGEVVFIRPPLTTAPDVIDITAAVKAAASAAMSRPTSQHSEPDRFVFRIGDAFPAGQPLARFSVSVGAALNDLLFLNRLYVFEERWGLMRREPRQHESIYLARLIMSCLFELLRLLGKGESIAEIKTFLHDLPEDGRADLKLLRRMSELRPSYERVRNTTLHYPWPDEAQLESALRAVQHFSSEIEAHESSMASVRAIFADSVLAQMLLKDPEAELTEEQLQQELNELVGGLTEHVTAAIRLCQHVLVAYLDRLADGVVEHHPSR